MNSYKTTGIVLKSTNFGEADKILTIFSERFGKIKVMAKGMRKIRSHMAGSLEAFMLVDLQLHEGRTFFIVTGASIIEEFHEIRNDLQKTARAFFLGELVDRFIEEKQKNGEVYEIFIHALSEVNDGLPGPLIQAFELKIVEASGFKPELFECVHCKEKLTPKDNFWDESEGGILCDKCQKIYHHGREISDDAIKLLRFIEKNDFQTISKLKISAEIERETDIILDKYIESVLERELKSGKFMKSL